MSREAAEKKNSFITEFDYGDALDIKDVKKLNIRFEDIVEVFHKNHPDADISILTKAYIFSAKEHRGQVRKSGEPYLVHPMHVARLLAEMKMDESTIAVGFLHDVVEDTLVTLEKIEEHFGKDIAGLVDGVTKVSQIEFHSLEHKQAENYRKLWLATAKDVRVILIKIADRLHNMSTLDALEPAKQKRIARETLEIYVPIANRLGMGNIQKDLQELCFKYLYPRQYKVLTEKIESEKKVSVATIQRIEKMLNKELSDEGLEVAIKGRIKSNFSIFTKMARQDIPLEEIYDYLAFRVITKSVNDCYAVLGVVHNIWRPIPGKFKDYIAMPKPNNYRSLHTSVIDTDGHIFEIQIRTEWMDIIAQEGLPSHWIYKEGGEELKRDPYELQYINWLRDLVQKQQEWENPDEFINALKIDLYPDKVYCFTPKGDVKSFPLNATALDFAYSVHTEVGNQCVGAKINGKIVPLKTVLKNGDVIEILTRKGSKPKRDWLHYAQTSSALTKIRQFLNKEEREESREVGEKLLRKELSKVNMNINKSSVKKDLINVCSDWGFNTLDEIYIAVGFGKLTLKQILNKLLPPDIEKKEVEEAKEPALVEKFIDKVTGRRGQSIISVKGHNDILVHLAKCCNPLPGEPIIGFITRGRGISIHAKSCPNVKKLMYNRERILDTEWSAHKGEKFLSRITVRTENVPGILAKLTHTLAELDINLRHLEAKSENQRRAIISLLAEIDDFNHLNNMLTKLQDIKGVVSVERTIQKDKE